MQTSLNNHRTLSKLRYYAVNSDILVKLCLIYLFLTYDLIPWGNTYSSTTQPLFILQKRAMRLMTFSKFREHSGPIFKQVLGLYKCLLFIYKFNYFRLPS